jgi:bifunctional enzyme CysN/CysC
VDWSQAAFAAIADEMRAFLARLGVTADACIPVSGLHGANLVTSAPEAPWYEGPSVLEVLDRFPMAVPAADAPFRLPVQDVYRFTRFGDDRRIVAGWIESGRIAVGDAVVFYPSGKRSRVATLERFHAAPLSEASAGESAGLTLDEQLYTTRGEMAVRADEPAPHVSTRLRASLFWLGRAPLVCGREYHLRLGTSRVPMRVERIERVLDASTLDTVARAEVARNDVADCVLKLDRPLAFDLHAERPETGRFVIVDDFEIRGGGIVREALEDGEELARDRVRLRNRKWEHSRIATDVRAARAAQRPTLVVVTGDREMDRKGVAKQLETRLFAAGRAVYFLGMANMLYGVDADIDRTRANRHEHFRRLGEIAHLMLDAGLILIVSAAELGPDDLDILKVSVPAEQIVTIWFGPADAATLACDLVVVDQDPDAACGEIEARLVAQGVLPRP